jgi:hypothetical protein
MDPSKGYNLRCTLTFGDIYAFTTTLLNHIALEPSATGGGPS